eukprot:comp23002_c0_seq1/m.36671 comp23002_c0_seq1/g.36671  ORF comp23002_c0_seq1/g.36671 comp23002_c0_seq1/m.36671 type:complete len:931 (-) comp23002_c0_seq1:405-3197(-)
MAGETSIFNGGSPLQTAIALLLVQIILIVLISRFLAIFLRRLHQPTVLAEVLGGIILGPSALGRIPGFLDTIFPPKSLPVLKGVADLGLVMFLFIVGLELELTLLRRTAKLATMVSIAGIILPFLAGFGVAKVLWDVLGTPDIRVGYWTFACFIAVAMSITAFPVLARMLAEFKLYSTPVGVTSITAAAVDDVIAWCFLALVVAISRSQGDSPVVVVYVILCTGAFALFMLFGVRPLLEKLYQRTVGDGDNGSEKAHIPIKWVVMAFMITCSSAFVTEALGVHAIFGGFLAGLTMPRRGGFAVGLIEKIEDFITIVMLPLYFTFSGLRTQITAVNTAEGWGVAILVIVCACSKIVGATGTCLAFRLPLRESLAVGVLMNTKGLVELIVLNVGLDAGAINRPVFVVMVLMALATTFMTSPLVKLVYPTSYQTKQASRMSRSKRPSDEYETLLSEPLSLVVYLETLKDAALALTFMNALGGFGHPSNVNTTNFGKNGSQNSYADGISSPESPTSLLSLSALKMHTVTDRNSTVLHATLLSVNNGQGPVDPILQNFRNHARTYGVEPACKTVVTTENTFADDIINAARLQKAKGVFVSWSPSQLERTTSSMIFNTSNSSNRDNLVSSLVETSPLPMLLFAQKTSLPSYTSRLQLGGRGLQHMFNHGSEYDSSADTGVSEMETTLNMHAQTVALPPIGSRRRVVVPYFGTEDDSAALLTALRLVRVSPHAVVHVVVLLPSSPVSGVDGDGKKVLGGTGAGPTDSIGVGAESAEVDMGQSMGRGRDTCLALAERLVQDESMGVAVVVTRHHTDTPMDVISAAIATCGRANSTANRATITEEQNPTDIPVGLVVCGRQSPSTIDTWAHNDQLKTVLPNMEGSHTAMEDVDVGARAEGVLGVVGGRVFMYGVPVVVVKGAGGERRDFGSGSVASEDV